MGYKGVLCYDLLNQKTLISWHVIHNEDIFPFKNTQCLSPASASQTISAPRSPVAIVMTSLPQAQPSRSSASSSPATSDSNPSHDDQMIPIFTDAQLEVLLPLPTSSSQM